MGYKYSYSAEDLAKAVGIIRSVMFDACDMKSDGYTQLGAKQDLWRLKWILDDAMKNCPHFGCVEDDWLREQEKKKIIRVLKDEV